MVYLGRWSVKGVKISLRVIIWVPNKAIDIGEWSIDVAVVGERVLLYIDLGLFSVWQYLSLGLEDQCIGTDIIQRKAANIKKSLT